MPPRRSARRQVRGVWSAGSHGVTGQGADGPARRSCSTSRALGTGPPPIHSPQTAAGHHRMTRSPSRSSSLGAAGESGIRAWGQREPARQGTGRLSGSARWLGWLKGGLDMPATHAEWVSLPREHPLWTLTRRAWSRAGRIGNAPLASHRSLLFGDALPMVPQPIKQGPGHGAVPFRYGRPFS